MGNRIVVEREDICFSFDVVDRSEMAKLEAADEADLISEALVS